MLGVGACGSGSANEPGFSLETATVERGALESSVEATGTVEAIRVLEVRSQASGEILNMPVELGDEVEQGALLLEIDPRDEVNEVEQARADLEQAQAQLAVAESRLSRMRALRDSGVVTAEELETAIVEHANARSAHVRAQTRLELAQEQRADATVRAPISGTIVEKGVEEGQVVTGTRDLTGGTVLLRMADLSEVQVRTLVDESEIGGVGPGLPASITVEAYPDRTFRGEVLQIEPQATVEQNVTMFAVLTRIPNESRLLKPGMNADVEIVLGRREGVLKLSNSAVKMPDEARQLVSALGMDPELLDRRITTGGEGAAASGDPEQSVSREETGALPGPERLRSMSREERRELLQSLSSEERRELMRRLPGGGPGGASASGAVSGPRPAFVFVREDGVLTLSPVTVGLSSWEETEIVAGLEEGDAVVEVPLALVQQSELLERFRRRSGVPGMTN
ncbi:MAG: efflux RND transporter periplasmic adaptor subunit [Gemmatimonadetes bacterium]|nr:efflux RND transporter periplasmic adaptor subunit [Gemmatimonadota bacterium]NIR79031.1 efflux RND transporter periplasmic adaptor subunit [Gemmatimonadota bacterium]NIT87685.1 efflux RND transporter periplasmic adaptor subunit [Gemmatimonadota bacterium]NIU31549.1 efflux RND transporter periplasmic adaptor subunit [Gemmatimonadota bacterium]NIU36205.1 efflux RND transporter periplasmic adaptor subunit [Gemmatimonadota bacterium]